MCMNNNAKLATKELLKTFIPLSLSDMIMVLAAPLTGVVLSRLPDARVHLAAQGAAQNMAIILESPIIMMLHASNAAAGSPRAYKALGVLMACWSIAITLLYAAIAFTPAYTWVAETALGLPHEMAAAAKPAFAVMLLWPAAIAIRRYLQGHLIHHRRSRDILFSVLLRLVTFVTVLIGAATAGLPGATAAGLAAVVSAITETGAVYYFSRKLRLALAPQPEVAEPAHSEVPDQFGRLFWWYLPLAGTQLLAWLARPSVTAGVARAGEAEISLAAWPVAWATVSVVANGTRMIQQLTIGMVRDRESFRVIRRFMIWIGIAFSLLLSLIAFTPLSDAYLAYVMGLPADLIAISKPVLAIAAFYPLQVSALNWMQGLLVAAGRTGWVNLCALAGGAATVGLVFAGALIWQLPGAPLAAGASAIGLLVELGCLWYFSSPVRQRLLLDLESLGKKLTAR